LTTGNGLLDEVNLRLLEMKTNSRPWKARNPRIPQTKALPQERNYVASRGLRVQILPPRPIAVLEYDARSLPRGA
jgi:hypothetical protein